MASSAAGRHRAPGRHNPLAEISTIVSEAASPAVKGTAVLAASGGLVAALAVPAAADTPAAPKDSAAPAVTAPIAPAVTAPTIKADKATPSATTFGEIEVVAVAKPKGPTPAQIRAARERAEREQAVREQAQREQSASQSSDQGSERSEQPASRSSARTAAPAPAPAPAPAAANGDVISIAKQYIGTPYVYGGSSPAGFDCSGFVQYVFAKAGKSLPRVTTAQQAATTPVSNPQPGDLVFFGSPSWHVGIYLGNGMMIDSPRTGSSISIRPVFSGVSGYGRVS